MKILNDRLMVHSGIDFCFVFSKNAIKIEMFFFIDRSLLMLVSTFRWYRLHITILVDTRETVADLGQQSGDPLPCSV